MFVAQSITFINDNRANFTGVPSVTTFTRLSPKRVTNLSENRIRNLVRGAYAFKKIFIVTGTSGIVIGFHVDKACLGSCLVCHKGIKFFMGVKGVKEEQILYEKLRFESLVCRMVSLNL